MKNNLENLCKMPFDVMREKEIADGGTGLGVFLVLFSPHKKNTTNSQDPSTCYS